MHWDLMADTEELAKGLAESKQKNAEQVYTKIVDALFAQE